MNTCKMFRSSFRQFNQQLPQQRLKSSQVELKKNSDWNHAVSEAEKIVGYPTSFLNLRWLLTDELASIALHFRKLLGINHPLLNTARKLFVGNTLPAWGLIVLLISKAGGLNSNFSENDRDLTAGILHSQRVLAEITEMVRTSNIIHKSLINMNGKEKDIIELALGNKVALLSGDFLLSNIFYDTASLRNQNMLALISSALRDLVDAEFLQPRDGQEIPLPCKPVRLHPNVTITDQFGTEPYSVKEVLGNPLAEWTLRNILGGASLLSKSCQGALQLAQHSEEVQELGFLFGKNTALACQAHVEQEAFAPDSAGMFSLVSAPVMLHLQYDPSLYEKIEKGKHNVLDVDFEELRRIIQNGPGLESARNLQKELSLNALGVLRKLPSSDARDALENIINTML